MTLLPWLPAIAALEGARWLTDTWATWLLYGEQLCEVFYRYFDQ